MGGGGRLLISETPMKFTKKFISHFFWMFEGEVKSCGK